jgi:molybdopterin-containing oxidoreductase family iron-sulfur binding subunit
MNDGNSGNPAEGSQPAGGAARQVSRRNLLKGAAAAAVVAAVGTSGLGLMKAGGSSESAAPARPAGQRPPRQWAMVIDLRKCDGCVTIDSPPQCTQHCKEAHFVPDGQEWIQVFEVEAPGGGKSFMPVPCMQCENAPCQQVCPVGATYTNENGIVLINSDRCIGCRFCIAACPYARRFFVWGKPQLPPEAYFTEYSPEYPVPARKGTTIKCMMCAHLTKEGKLPHCVQGCPMGAIYLGDLVEDRATNGEEIVILSHFLSENSAFRLKEELGTRPRVYYIPGHGQEFKRTSTDERPLQPVPDWKDGGAQPRATQPATPSPKPSQGASSHVRTNG